MSLGDPPTDGQPDAAPLVPLSRVQALKRSKDTIQKSRFESDSVVFYLKNHLFTCRAASLDLPAHPYFGANPCALELGGVAGRF